MLRDDDLPPLPEGWEQYPGCRLYYAVEQMREYARAVERAAYKLAAEACRAQKNPPPVLIADQVHYDPANAMAERCATVISLLGADEREAKMLAEIDRLRQASEPTEARIECHGLDTPERVCFYEQDFYVLSNFSSFSVQWRGHRYPTSEHAYHVEKFRNYRGDIADMIAFAPSAHDAFKLAERHKSSRRLDWDDVKVKVMREILRAKAEQHEYVRRKLLETGDRELVENSWRDDFWGWGPNRNGKNMLGKLWMEIRAELRAALAVKDAT